MPAARAAAARRRTTSLNALAALATVLPLEIAPADAARACCATTRGLEHRLEPVGDGRRACAFVNDSKATNVGSLEVALAELRRSRWC